MSCSKTTKGLSIKSGEPRPLGRGYVHIYTGDCKGKTTAALDLAFRAMGRGLRTYIGQFMKGVHYGELDAARMVPRYITIKQYSKNSFTHTQNPPLEEDITLAREGLEKGQQAMLSAYYAIIVLDEIITAHSFCLLSTEEVLELIERRPDGIELILTGRHAPQQLVDAADLVTEMKELKHYYQRGVKAQDGIER